jgi:hypothetical protein
MESQEQKLLSLAKQKLKYSNKNKYTAHKILKLSQRLSPSMICWHTKGFMLLLFNFGYSFFLILTNLDN